MLSAEVRKKWKVKISVQKQGPVSIRSTGPFLLAFFLLLQHSFSIQNSAFSISCYHVTLAPKRMTRGAMMLLMLFGGSVVEDDPTPLVAL